MSNVYEELETRITRLVNHWLETVDPAYPGHADRAWHGAGCRTGFGTHHQSGKRPDFSRFAGQRSPSGVHRSGAHPQISGFECRKPTAGGVSRVRSNGWILVKYRMTKGFVIATIEPGKPTRVERRVLHGRRFMDKFVQLDTADDIAQKIPAGYAVSRGNGWRDIPVDHGLSTVAGTDDR